MENTTKVHWLKERIKSFAELQKLGKRARKTTIPAEESKALLRKCGVDTPSDAHWQVMRRKTEITACLNLYHELRGSTHRHGIQADDQYAYDRAMGSLTKDLAKV
jgi:hypothetical protein